MAGTPISSIRNIGPKTAHALEVAGFKDAEHVRDAGADEAYRRYLTAGFQPHFIGYYAFVMGLQGRPWNDCIGAEKAKLRKQFDALKAESAKNTAPTSMTKLDRALEEFGLVPVESAGSS